MVAYKKKITNFAPRIFDIQMENNKQYMIQLSEMPLGKTELRFHIDDDFFANKEYSEIKKGTAELKLTIDKQCELFTMLFEIRGQVEVACCRCNAMYMQPVEKTFKMFVKIGSENKEESDDVIVITKEMSEINIEDWIYEYIILSLPIRCVHDNIEDCDQEVIKYLEQDNEKSEQDNDEVDPRWEKLKELK